MSIKEFDIAIIGGTLSARIAAALLAKSGRRVLFLRQREETAPTWFHSSLFLEKLLGVLGGRACFTAPEAIQVISAKARITLHPDIPLEEELKRELGEAADQVREFLSDLQTIGFQIEELFWENGGLAWPTLRGAARFKLLCMRRKIKLSEMARPVSDLIATVPEPAQPLLTDLFQGLALMDARDICLAKAALLWAHASRLEQLKEPDFSQMLSKRLEQFRGAKGDLEELAQLDHDGRNYTGGRLREGGQFTANLFLLGDVRYLNKFPSQHPKELPGTVQTYQHPLGDLTGKVSSLLEKRVICGGGQPMRLTINGEDVLTGQVIAGGSPPPETLSTQLEAVLPFVDYNLDVLDAAPTANNSAPPATTLDNLPLVLSGNLYCADSTILLPGLGAAGAALLGWTLAEQLADNKF